VAPAAHTAASAVQAARRGGRARACRVGALQRRQLAHFLLISDGDADAQDAACAPSRATSADFLACWRQPSQVLAAAGAGATAAAAPAAACLGLRGRIFHMQKMLHPTALLAFPDESSASTELRAPQADEQGAEPSGLPRAVLPAHPAWLVETQVMHWDYSGTPLAIWGGDHGHHRHHESAPEETTAHHMHAMHYLSPCMTIMVGLCASLLALRLLRDLSEPRGNGEGGGAAGDPEDGQPPQDGAPPGGMVALETPGLTPFRPFGGTGHRLADATPAAAGQASASSGQAPSAAAQAPAVGQGPCQHGASGAPFALPPRGLASAGNARPAQGVPGATPPEDIPVVPG